MKKDLTDRNTVSGYLDQGVSSFSEYIAVNLTHLVVRILCFIHRCIQKIDMMSVRSKRDQQTAVR